MDGCLIYLKPAVKKKKSSMQVLRYNNHALEVFSQIFIISKILCIHYNAVEAGPFGRAEDYLLSSA